MNIIQTKRTAVNVTTGVMSFILPQNGVVEGAVRYGPAEAASRDSHSGGNGGSGETPKRPKNLPVTAATTFATKNIRDDLDDIDHGSLPCTPELEPDASGSENEALEMETRELLNRFLSEFTGLQRPRWHQSKALSAMKRVVNGLLEKHQYAYNGMINKLSMDEGGSDARLVGLVAKSLFSDGTTNWGRVASLVAFGAVVSQYMKGKGRSHCVEQVGQEISSYLLTEQRDWLVNNNSWDGFVEFFRVSDPESTVRNTLMACVGVAGLGATLALLIR